MPPHGSIGPSGCKDPTALPKRPAHFKGSSMQIIEFFFGNFWHWLGLVLMLGILITVIEIIAGK